MDPPGKRAPEFQSSNLQSSSFQSSNFQSSSFQSSSVQSSNLQSSNLQSSKFPGHLNICFEYPRTGLVLQAQEKLGYSAADNSEYNETARPPNWADYANAPATHPDNVVQMPEVTFSQVHSVHQLCLPPSMVPLPDDPSEELNDKAR